MAKVIAVEKGYWGGMIREVGDVFDMPADEAKFTQWVKPDPATAFGGKGDHDGDGFVGGSKPADEKPAKRGRKAKAETVEGPEAEPFADAPEPTTIAEAQAELGTIQPDWVPQPSKEI